MLEDKIGGKIRKEQKQIRREIRERTLTYIVAAFGLVAGLAWNEAVKSLIDYFFPLSANTLLAKFVYAILITAVVVMITIYLEKLFRRNEKEN